MEDEAIKLEIARRIKKLREKKQETQSELAKAIHVTQDNISKIETAKISLTLENLLSIADHYHVSCDYICTGNDTDTILTLLNKYVKLQFSKGSLGEEHFTYPEMEISKTFFDFLIQSAYANATEILPKALKKQWLELAESNFYKEVDNESLEYKSVIPVTGNLIFPDDDRKDWKQADLLREIDQQLKDEISESKS